MKESWNPFYVNETRRFLPFQRIGVPCNCDFAAHQWRTFRRNPDRKANRGSDQAESGISDRGAVLETGDTTGYGSRVMLFDKADRSYLIELREGAEFQVFRNQLVIGSMEIAWAIRSYRRIILQASNGVVSHAVLREAGFGGIVRTHSGRQLRVRRPTLQDFVLNMPRAATPVYPKVSSMARPGPVVT